MIYIFSFLIVFAVFIGMVLGTILNNKPIAGSCGGLACQVCSKRKKCLAKKPEAGLVGNDHGL